MKCLRLGSLAIGTAFFLSFTSVSADKNVDFQRFDLSSFLVQRAVSRGQTIAKQLHDGQTAAHVFNFIARSGTCLATLGTFGNSSDPKMSWVMLMPALGFISADVLLNAGDRQLKVFKKSQKKQALLDSVLLFRSGLKFMYDDIETSIFRNMFSDLTSAIVSALDQSQREISKGVELDDRHATLLEGQLQYILAIQKRDRDRFQFGDLGAYINHCNDQRPYTN